MENKNNKKIEDANENPEYLTDPTTGGTVVGGGVEPLGKRRRVGGKANNDTENTMEPAYTY